MVLKRECLDNILSVFMSEQPNILVSRETTDSVVYSIVQQFIQRSDFGFKKYGTNLDRTDLSVLDWIQHAQEEHMDAILYLEKLKQEYQKRPQTDAQTQSETEN
jgi:hypothetical protein